MTDFVSSKQNGTVCLFLRTAPIPPTDMNLTLFSFFSCLFFSTNKMASNAQFLLFHAQSNRSLDRIIVNCFFCWYKSIPKSFFFHFFLRSNSGCLFNFIILAIAINLKITYKKSQHFNYIGDVMEIVCYLCLSINVCSHFRSMN